MDKKKSDAVFTEIEKYTIDRNEKNRLCVVVTQVDTEDNKSYKFVQFKLEWLGKDRNTGEDVWLHSPKNATLRPTELIPIADTLRHISEVHFSKGIKKG